MTQAERGRGNAHCCTTGPGKLPVKLPVERTYQLPFEAARLTGCCQALHARGRTVCSHRPEGDPVTGGQKGVALTRRERGCSWRACRRSEERRVGKEGRARWG